MSPDSETRAYCAGIAISNSPEGFATVPEAGRKRPAIRRCPMGMKFSMRKRRVRAGNRGILAAAPGANAASWRHLRTVQGDFRSLLTALPTGGLLLDRHVRATAPSPPQDVAEALTFLGAQRLKLFLESLSPPLVPPSMSPMPAPTAPEQNVRQYQQAQGLNEGHRGPLEQRGNQRIPQQHRRQREHDDRYRSADDPHHDHTTLKLPHDPSFLATSSSAYTSWSRSLRNSTA